MKKGFTLVELIAVIAIIGILAIMILPNVIDIFNQTGEDTMIIAENQVRDAANLYIEDYCRNPIDDEHRTNCLQDKKSINENKVYFCLSTLQGRKIIKEVYYEETTSCKGVVVYDVNNNKYSTGKVYLYCGNEYETEGGSTYKRYANGC